jgi:predicted transcriptional regulator
MAKEKPKKLKIRIQLVIDESIDSLLEQIAEKERRTKSAIIEIAILEYAAKSKDKT